MVNSNYYNSNADAFFNDTIDVDASSLYQEFMPYLPTNAKIIDAGCGSGRDTHHFLKNDHDVIAFDSSEKLRQLATERTKHPILHTTFLEFSTKPESQDAIWACASLLHVPMNELTQTFLHLSQFLKTNGIFYCSFKYGNNETNRNGRRFTNLNEALLIQLLKSSPLVIKKIWITEDLRLGRTNEKWLNTILTKL
ncbi:class I SAM-dependent methyltransferase [Aliivibrio sifiae]|uniref:SAM-dependent methyltransferase n=1 Tax=Aliivibrio sifiae TaxID=566293 RepID=A0A2S7X494_9GAMM|nr:class I SAM-dependent methyltransferase [Aliivibrio sifiae]PQJ85037.1 SAM-dependent methyltransferase [Aliivibrio sifiae]